MLRNFESLMLFELVLMQDLKDLIWPLWLDSEMFSKETWDSWFCSRLLAVCFIRVYSSTSAVFAIYIEGGTPWMESLTMT